MRESEDEGEDGKGCRGESEETDVRMTGSVAADTVASVAVERLLEIDEEEEKRG